MSSPRPSFRHGLPALLILTLFVGPPARPEVTGASAADPGAISLPDEPRLLAAQDSVALGPLVPRTDGGFLLAWASYYEDLTVAKHSEDGSREALLHLGGLGYSGLSNLRSLQPFDDDSFVVAWDNDHHYFGFQGSVLAMIRPHGPRVESRTRRAPALVADGKGGAIGFYVEGQHTFIGQWNGSGRLLRQREIHRSVFPWKAWPYRGGILLRSHQVTSPYGSFTQWFDANGKLIESVPGRGALATNGEDVVAELGVSSGLLAVRLAESPGRLGRFRVVDVAPGGSAYYSVALTVTPAGGAVAAWTTSPPRGHCGIWVRSVSPDGTPGARAICAAGPGSDRPALATGASGKVWLVWRTTKFVGLEERGRIWLRTLALS